MARSAAELSTSMQHRIFQNSFGLDGYFIFGSSRFSVSGNKCRDLRAQSFFVPAAAIVVLAEQLLVSATRPSSAEYRNPVRGLPGGTRTKRKIKHGKERNLLVGESANLGQQG
jgi:hypothetical protein